MWTNPAVYSIRERCDWNEQVYNSCAPVLEKYSVTFKVKGVIWRSARNITHILRGQLVKSVGIWSSRMNGFDAIVLIQWATTCFLLLVFITDLVFLTKTGWAKERTFGNSEVTEAERSGRSETVGISLMPQECGRSFLAWRRSLERDHTVNVLTTIRQQGRFVLLPVPNWFTWDKCIQNSFLLFVWLECCVTLEADSLWNGQKTLEYFMHSCWTDLNKMI